MTRRAFTLMELLVSITLISIIIIYLYQATSTLRLSNTFYERKIEDEQKKEQLYFVLFRDVMNADSNRTSILEIDKNIDSLRLQGDNSHFDFIRPNIAYHVTKKGVLLRVESTSSLTLPANSENAYRLHAEIIRENIEIFKVHRNKTNGELLFYIKTEDSPTPSIFQLGI